MAIEHKRMQQRGETEAVILEENEVPLARELIVAHDTGTMWIGDGYRRIDELPKFTPNSGASLIDGGDPYGSDGPGIRLDGGTPA